MPCRRAACIASSATAAVVSREGGEDAAGVQPAHAQRAEEVVPVDVAGRRAAAAAVCPRSEQPTRSADAEAALGEVQPVADRAGRRRRNGTHWMKRGSTPPCRMRSSTRRPTSLSHERGDDRGPQPEAPAQPAGDVVLAAALPDPERARGADAPLAGVEAQHDLAQRHQRRSGTPRRAGTPASPCRPPRARAATTASAAAAQRGDLVEAPLAHQRRRRHQLPPTASTAGRGQVGGQVRRRRSRRSGRSAAAGTGRRARRSSAAPPSGSAGKNLTTSSPRSRAAITSVGGRHTGEHRDAKLRGSGERRRCRSPGETMNRAPASTARSTCCGVDHRAGADEDRGIAGQALDGRRAPRACAASPRSTRAHRGPAPSRAGPRRRRRRPRRRG